MRDAAPGSGVAGRSGPATGSDPERGLAALASALAGPAAALTAAERAIVPERRAPLPCRVDRARLAIVRGDAPLGDAATTGAIACFRTGRDPRAIRFRPVDALSELGSLQGGPTVARSRLEAARRWSPFLRPAAPGPGGHAELGEAEQAMRESIRELGRGRPNRSADAQAEALAPVATGRGNGDERKDGRAQRPAAGPRRRAVSGTSQPLRKTAPGATMATLRVSSTSQASRRCSAAAKSATNCGAAPWRTHPFPHRPRLYRTPARRVLKCIEPGARHSLNPQGISARNSALRGSVTARRFACADGSGASRGEPNRHTTGASTCPENGETPEGP